MNNCTQADNGWWFVEYKSGEGWAPSDFLEPAPNADKAAPNSTSVASLTKAKAAPPRPVAVKRAAPNRPKVSPNVVKYSLIIDQ